MKTTEDIFNLLSEIPDPEIPVISIIELGVIRNVEISNDTTVSLKNWLTISFSERVSDDQWNQFIDSIMNNAYNHGLEVDQPLDYVFGDYNAIKKERDPVAAATKFLDDTIKKHKNIQLLLVILPGTTPLYGVLKTYGDLRNGIISQAVNETTIYKQKGRYDRLASNLCMKINAKLGGKNFVLSGTNK